MTSPATYEERLWLFAQGKRLRRFRGLLRMPRDTFCDACGSSMPSHLFGLRDMETKRDYFVGANCMSRLSQMLLIERPFVKADIVTAYALARNMPEKLRLPHQPDLNASEHPCCIHGRYGNAYEDPEQRAQARAQAERIRIVKLAGEQRYLARSRTVEPGSYYELTVAWGRVRCSCPGFQYRGVCKHAAALRARLTDDQGLQQEQTGATI